MEITEIFKNIYLFKDIVNVYAIQNENKAILIDFGSGNILNYLSELGIDNVDYIFHTHYHRDQCFGDKIALEKNIKIAAPYIERKLFSAAEEFWKTKSYYDLYYFKPTFFVSTYNIPLSLTFKDGDIFEYDPYQFKICKTNGHTTGSVSYIIENNGKKLVFSGDLIHAGGKVITFYDLEYVYNDNGEEGMKNSMESFKRLLEFKPDFLLPSHGEIIEDPKGDIDSLTKKFERARFGFCSELSSMVNVEFPEANKRAIKPVVIEDLFPHLFHRDIFPPFILKGKNRNCILIDFAGDNAHGYKLDEFDKILRDLGIDRIDFIIPTHYHDDHVAGIPLLQKKYNLKVYALENMVDVLENPIHYRLGCLIDQHIKVHRVLKEGETIKWDDYQFQVYHFPGQTEYHMGLFGKIDGKSIFFTGDTITQRSFVDRDTNVNCINFCRLGNDVGYMKCADILLKCNPEYIAISHYGIIKVNEELLKKFKNFVSDYESIISDIVAQADPNIGFDPNWICFKPIRIIAKPGNQIKTNLAIRNYLNKQIKMEFELNIPKDWKASPLSDTCLIEPKAFIDIPISIIIPKNVNPSGRTIITANITWDGKNIGPFPDLMIDHGYIPTKDWNAWNPEHKFNLFFAIYKRSVSSKRLFE